MKKQMTFLALIAFVFFLSGGTSEARWLNPNSGRFQTMDTYEGEQQDPQSLHKYLYVHADPVNNVDPSGNNLISLSISVAIGQGLQTHYNAAVTTAGNSMKNTIWS